MHYQNQANNRRPARPAHTNMAVAETTGPLHILRDKRIMVLADVQNLDGGARDLGYRLCWSTLGNILDASAAKASRHAVLSKVQRDASINEFDKLKWNPTVKIARMVNTGAGQHMQADTDLRLAFLAGVLVSRASADIVVIASGDGELVEEVAEAVISLKSPRKVVTLSLSGSTAERLDASVSPLIFGNIEIGRDCLRPISANRPGYGARKWR